MIRLQYRQGHSSKMIFFTYFCSNFKRRIMKMVGCSNIIGINYGFSCINIRQVPWEVLKTEAEQYQLFKTNDVFS